MGGASHLVLRDGAQRQRRVDLAPLGERVSLGRSEAAHVRLDWDPEISRVHAELIRVADTWTIVDDGLSTNGTYVNHERLRARRVLSDGDTIRVGETHLVYRDGRPRARTTARREHRAAVAVTPAQRRVLVALCRPFASGAAFATPATNAEIASELHLSVDAVKGHVRLLFQALAVEDVDRDRRRTCLAERAFATGTVDWRDFDPPEV